MSRKCPNCGQKSVNFPLLGEVSIFSLVVLLFCVAFAVLWAVTRRESFSWFGQDVLVSLRFLVLVETSLSIIIAVCKFKFLDHKASIDSHWRS